MNTIHNKIGDYSLNEKLAENYKSIIFRGTHNRSNETVLIKVLKKQFKTPSEIVLLKQETKQIQGLKIDGIVKNYDVIINQSDIAFIYEDSGGYTLKNYINKYQLSTLDFLNIAIQLSGTLAKIHLANIIHKNLKPQNIYLKISKNKIIDSKISDFGYSFLLNDQLGELYNPGVIESILPYISPEQTGRMSTSIDHRTDLYSLGLLFYEILNKKPPFTSLDPLEIIHSHLAIVPKPLHEINKSIPIVISSIIQKLISKSPDDRYQSAAGLKIELEICSDQIRDTGKIYSLNPGQMDIIDHFSLPQKLIGREEEVQKILEAFDYISKGRSGVVLVSGVPGIGKSSIIKEVNKPIINARGYFSTGKYDQLRKDVPFSSIIQAFQNLVRQILTESDNKVQRWRRSILSAVGENGQVITKLIPELELIIGAQPETVILNPEETQNRFNHLFTNLIKSFATTDHPFVLFLDDVQWADPPSLALLRTILSDSLVNNFLLILSYRETLINFSHPFSIFIEELKRQKTKIDRIYLKPLLESNIESYMEIILRKNGDKVKDLSHILYEKTRGNPFFLNQFVRNLYDDKIIYFDQTTGWEWDLKKVQSMQVTDNVIELMIIKINKLSDSARKLIIYGSCIGNRFTLEGVCNLADMSYEDALVAIDENIKEGLIYLSNTLYRFLHDRIQEAAYSLIPIEEKSKIHLKIGRMTLDGLSKSEISDKIFFIVDHLNHGIEFLENEKSIYELIHFNLLAGKKALSSAAYEPSYHYMKIGFTITEKYVKDNIWINDYATALNLYSYCAETSYLCAKYEEMEDYSNVVLKKANNLLDIVKIYEIKIKTEIAKNNFPQSIDYGLEILRKLNIKFPKNPNQFDQAISLFKSIVSIYIKGMNFFLHSPPATDPNILAAVRIISSINSVAYWVKPKLLPLLILKVVRISYKYGPTIYTPYNLTGMGLIISDIGLFNLGNKIGNIALSLSDRLNSPDQKPRTLFVYYTFIKHWNSSLRETLKPLSEIFHRALEVGDLEFASHSAFVDVYYSYSSGIELEEVQKKISLYLDDKKNIRYQIDVNAIHIYQQSIYNFQGRSKDNSKLKGKYYDFDLMVPLHIEAGDKTTLFHVYLCSMFHSFMNNRFSKALEFSEKIIPVMEGEGSVYGLIVYYFYDSLNKIMILRQGITKNKIQYIIDIKNNIKKFEKWKKYSPANCNHKYNLILAELLSYEEKVFEAIPLYEAAIKDARKNQFLQEEALSLELAGAFYLDLDYRDHAKNMILLARSAYMKWGAPNQVAKLDNIYVNLLKESTAYLPGSIGLSKNSSTLDTSTILKSSQALSGEIDLSKLLTKILNVSIENAGAQRGILILSKKGKLFVEAEANAIGGEIISSTPLDDYKEVPISIINYVRKTGQSIVLPNAFEKGMFTDDTYIYSKKMKSVLCAPILHKGNMSGILYLENNLSPNVFIRERLELLSILSSQAAISIENALLLAQREISAKLSKEMEITSKIQRSLIPEKCEVRGFDLTGYMKPAESVGGDYYDVINTPGKDWIVIGDVSGHGILSGLIMMMVQTSIHLILSRKEETTPSQLLKEIINGIEENIKKISGSQFKYMTITVLSYEGDGIFTYAGQHQDMILYRKKSSSIELIPTEGIWIGLGKMNQTSITSIQDKRFQMNSGDTLFLYTDGLTESETSDGKMFGTEGVSEILINNESENSSNIKDNILKKLEAYTTKDDTTFLILKKD
jgi:predicted ATPase/serine phosphatase RsbU (regulator of sigma subunit)